MTPHDRFMGGAEGPRIWWSSLCIHGTRHIFNSALQICARPVTDRHANRCDAEPQMSRAGEGADAGGRSTCRTRCTHQSARRCTQRLTSSSRCSVWAGWEFGGKGAGALERNIMSLIVAAVKAPVHLDGSGHSHHRWNCRASGTRVHAKDRSVSKFPALVGVRRCVRVRNWCSKTCGSCRHRSGST